MPEGQSLTIVKGQYPQIEGLEPNAKVKYSGEATINWNGDEGTITFDSMEFETENKADRELKSMRGVKDNIYMNNDEVEDI